MFARDISTKRKGEGDEEECSPVSRTIKHLGINFVPLYDGK